MINPIPFKSIPLNYNKEERGIKNNTIRKFDPNDKRHRYLLSLIDIPQQIPCTMVRMINSENNLVFFDRYLQDISFWDGFLILTWGHVQ